MTGISYLVIFFAAIFANFFVIESLVEAPVEAIQQHGLMVRLGIFAFLVTVLFDVIIAWTLYEMYKAHPLSALSSAFRLMHATIMGVGIFALPMALTFKTAPEILSQVERFKMIWLIGLFFFGAHLLLLGNILKRPKLIAVFLVIAGIMYMVDTAAHILLPNYADYSAMFLALVAIPSIIGEMSLAIWLLAFGQKPVATS